MTASGTICYYAHVRVDQLSFHVVPDFYYILSNIPTRCNVKQYSLLLSMLYMFQAVSPPIIGSSKLYTQHLVYVSQARLLLYMFQAFLRPSSGAQNCTHSIWYTSVKLACCSTCFRRFLRPSSGAQNCTHSNWYTSVKLACCVAASTLD